MCISNPDDVVPTVHSVNFHVGAWCGFVFVRVYCVEVDVSCEQASSESEKHRRRALCIDVATCELFFETAFSFRSSSNPSKRHCTYNSSFAPIASVLAAQRAAMEAIY